MCRYDDALQSTYTTCLHDLIPDCRAVTDAVVDCLVVDVQCTKLLVLDDIRITILATLLCVAQTE